MATLAPLTPSLTGPLIGLTAAAVGGDQFLNTGREYLVITTVGTACTVTVDSPATCSFGLTAIAAHDQAVVVGTNEQRVIGPFPTARFNDGGGYVQLTYSAVTAVTVGIIKP